MTMFDSLLKLCEEMDQAYDFGGEHDEQLMGKVSDYWSEKLRTLIDSAREEAAEEPLREILEDARITLKECVGLVPRDARGAIAIKAGRCVLKRIAAALSRGVGKSDGLTVLKQGREMTVVEREEIERKLGDISYSPRKEGEG